MLPTSPLPTPLQSHARPPIPPGRSQTARFATIATTCPFCLCLHFPSAQYPCPSPPHPDRHHLTWSPLLHPSLTFKQEKGVGVNHGCVGGGKVAHQLPHPHPVRELPPARLAGQGGRLARVKVKGKVVVQTGMHAITTHIQQQLVRSPQHWGDPHSCISHCMMAA